VSRIATDFSFTALMELDICENITATEIYVLTTYMDDSIAKRIEMFEKMGNSVQVIYLDDKFARGMERDAV